MNRTVVTALVGGLIGAAILGLIGVFFSIWTAMEYRGVGGDEPLLALIQALKLFSLLIPVGAIMGIVLGGLWGVVRNAGDAPSGTLIVALKGVLTGGLILGILGVLIGTLLGLGYGREWGRVPTPFAVLALWAMLGLPGFAVGGAIGAVVGVTRQNIRGDG